MAVKKRILYLAIVAVAAVSCDFLKEDPGSFVDREGYYKTEAQCRSAVNSCYEGLRTIYTTSLFTIVEGNTDLVVVPSVSDVNAIMDINPSQCNISKTVWSACYKAVMYCNAAIA